jgi:hypothetical protein
VAAPAGIGRPGGPGDILSAARVRRNPSALLAIGVPIQVTNRSATVLPRKIGAPMPRAAPTRGKQASCAVETRHSIHLLPAEAQAAKACSRSLTSATMVAFTGAGTPSGAPTRGIEPFMASISLRWRAR